MREQLTEHDVKKIEEEIEYRKLVVRKEAIEAVKEARAHGDLSEKFRISCSKERQKSQRKQNPLSGEDVKDGEDRERHVSGG